MKIADINYRKNSPRPPIACRCPICGDEELKNCYVTKEMVNGTRERFDYALCGALYLTNPPADIGRYYSSYYTNSEINSAQAPSQFTERIKFYLRNRLSRAAMQHTGKLASKLLDRCLQQAPVHGFRAIQRLKPATDAAILDVGCGAGVVVEGLDRIGFLNVCGIDPFLTQEKTFRNGGRLLRKPLTEVSGAYDYIMLHHCFEHVPDPVATARHIAEKLKPGGCCLLRFPNVNSVEFDRYGENWWGFHAPRHYFLLSRKALELVFKDTGMQIEQVWCDSLPDHYFYSYEYMLDLADNDPESVRALGKKSPHWSDIERRHIAHNVPWYNENLVGDWIGYILRKSH